MWPTKTPYIYINASGDITTPLQNAIDILQSNQGGIVEIGAGDCTISSTITISNGYPSDGSDYRGGITIRGQSQTGTRITYSGSGKAFVIESDNIVSSTGVLQYLNFESFSLFGPGKTTSGSVGMHFATTTAAHHTLVNRFTMKEVIIRYFETLMNLDDCGFNYFERCSFYDAVYGWGLGYNVDGIVAVSCQWGSSLDLGSENMNNALYYNYDSPWAATSPGSNQAHKFIGCFFMHCGKVANIYQASSCAITFDSCYYESCKQYATLGNNTNSSTAPKQVRYENCHFSRMYMGGVSAVINSAGSGGTNGTGYTDIVVTGGDGSGVTATYDVVGGSVTNLVITNPGYGYVSTSLPTITFGKCANATTTVSWVGEPWPKFAFEHNLASGTLSLKNCYTDDASGPNGGWIRANKGGSIVNLESNTMISAAGDNQWQIGCFDSSTTLNGAVAAGALTFTTNASIAQNSYFALYLTNGEIFYGKQLSVTGTTVTFRYPVPSAAANGATVVHLYGKKVVQATNGAVVNFGYSTSAANSIVDHFNMTGTGSNTKAYKSNRAFNLTTDYSVMEEWVKVGTGDDTAAGAGYSIAYTTGVNANGALVGKGWHQLTNTTTALPTATAALNGMFYFLAGGVGAADNLYICMKSAADTYSWKLIVTG